MTKYQNEMEAKYPSEKTIWFYTYHVPMCWISVVVGSITLILFYVFPKNRRFPSSIAAWATSLDVVFHMFELVKWSPFTSYHELLNYTPTERICRLFYSWVSFVDGGQTMCTLFLSFVIYNSIVRKVDMDFNTNPNYFWIMVIIFWCYSLFWTFFIAFVPNYYNAPGATMCAFAGEYGYLYDVAMIAQYLFITVFEVYFLGRSFIYIKQVWQLARSNKTKDAAMAKLSIRFFCIVCLQAGPRIIWHILMISRNAEVKVDFVDLSFLYFAMVFPFVCYMIDYFILLATNRPLRKKLISISTNISSSFTQTREEKIANARQLVVRSTSDVNNSQPNDPYNSPRDEGIEIDTA